MTLEDDESKSHTTLDAEALVEENALPAEIVAIGMSKSDAELWLRVTAQLHRDLGRPVKPKDFVAFARTKSPDAKAVAELIFRVDSQEAAERYYELTAAYFCRCVRVFVSGDTGPIRAIVRVTDTSGHSGYVGLDDAARRPDYRQQVLADAARELRYFRTKFSSLKAALNSPHLDRALAAVEAAEKELGAS